MNLSLMNIILNILALKEVSVWIFLVKITRSLYLKPKLLSLLVPNTDGKESACNEEDPGLIPGSGRSPREGHGNPLQYSCLENPMDEESGGLHSMGSQRVWHHWVANTFTFNSDWRLNRSCWQSWSVCNRLFQDVIGRETVTKESQTEHCLLTVCKILDW